jgi:hypothetical protein
MVQEDGEEKHIACALRLKKNIRMIKEEQPCSHTSINK